mgnify:CR=1 FL=1
MKTTMIVTASLMSFAASATAMDLGTNFWNLGWHKPDDCFKDVKNVTGDDPWNPQFLKEIAIYSSFRFMDWDNTNNSKRSKWSERPHKTNAHQNPVAYEWMIDLCNRMNADMWVTLPHLTVTSTTADNPADYALRFCILAKTGVDMKDVDLKPMLGQLAAMTADDFIKAGGEKTTPPLKDNLKLYIEYSNETWNGMFKQTHYCLAEGTALKLDPDGKPNAKGEIWSNCFRFHAYAAIRLFRAADLVWGEGHPRIVKVLAEQTGQTFIAGQHLTVMADPKLNPWGVKADAMASAPYFGHKVAGDAADAAAQLREAIKKSSSDSAKLKAVADKAGLKLIAYEGGQHVLKNADVINRQPVMFDLYNEYLREMSNYFSHFCHYAHVGKAGARGCWGCIEFTGQPIAEAPKYRALAEWSKAHNKPREIK